MSKHSITAELLSSNPSAFQKATQSNFLKSAALGKTPKDVLGTWLANDRLYIHSYIKAIGRLLTVLDLPQQVPEPADCDPASIKLLDWIVASMVNIRREEKFFIDVARKFGIEVSLKARGGGKVEDADKLEGLRRYEGLFGSLEAGPEILPWLEGAVLFYATEKCYLDAWTWSKAQLVEQEASLDADGGALRTEFINNWTCDEFVQFVKDLGDIIDQGVEEQVAIHGEAIKKDLFERAVKVWSAVLSAEEAFWPDIPANF